jgi:hypothetical protein
VQSTLLGRSRLSGERFDELAKDLAAKTTSRRKFLAGLAGAAAGALFGASRASGVVPPGGSTCSNEGQSCTAQQCCQGLNCLTDFTNSTEKFCCAPDTPLVCGSKCCPTGAVLGCSAGKCTCPTGEVVCPDANNPLAGKCVNLVEDVNNCGACGVTCADPTGPNAPCRVAACVNGGCTTVPKPGSNGLPCETGNLCTTDTCQNGTCQQGAVTVTCPQCQECDPTTGTCTNLANGTACDDGNPCTVNDTCQAGFCTPGAAKNCNDNNECTVDTCDPTTGNCVHTPVSNGTPCETGNLCTTDTCQNGTCQQGAVTVTCQQCEKCNPATGTCVPNPGAACTDNNPCTVNDTCNAVGVCTGTPLVCAAPQICCTTGMHAGTCKLPSGATCMSNGSCCSNSCTGPAGNRKCA